MHSIAPKLYSVNYKWKITLSSCVQGAKEHCKNNPHTSLHRLSLWWNIDLWVQNKKTVISVEDQGDLITIFSKSPKNEHQVQTNMKAMLICSFYVKGIIHKEFVHRARWLLSSSAVLFEVASRQVWQKYSEMWPNQMWMLHHNVAPVHSSLIVREF